MGPARFRRGQMPTVLNKIMNKIVQVPVVSNAVAYTTGDAVGQKIQLVNFFSNVGQYTRLVNAIIFDNDNQNTAAYQIFFWNEDYTAVADNAPWVLVDAEAPRMQGICNVPTGTVVNMTGNCAYQASWVNSWLPLVMPSGTTRDLWMQLRVTGTPTYTSTSAITVQLAFEME